MVGGDYGPMGQTHGQGLDRGQHFAGQARVHAPPFLQMPLLSLGVLSVQAVWSLDMAFAPPYLLELGLTKSGMAAVFIAGPLSGLIVQPCIGNLADNSTSRLGRRRPFLAISTLICALAVLMLGFASEVAAWFAPVETDTHRNVAVAVGIMSVYLVDFSVNAVMALNRSLMVDVATIEQQADANAWAARLCGVGAVLSFLMGNLDLPSIVPSFFGTTQIQIISVIASICLLTTHAVVLWLVEEQVLISHGPSGQNPSLIGVFRDLCLQAKQLPQPILEIFKIQFFAQIGWFPVLFYSTVWVGEIYKADVRAAGGRQSDHELYEEAIRVGSKAFFWYSVLSLLTSIILPLMVPEPVDGPVITAYSRFPWLKRIEKLRKNWPGLPFWWVFSHFVFCTAMMGTWLAGLTQSVFMATLVIAVVGTCFAVSNWVPYGLLGIIIQTQNGGPASASILRPSSRVVNETEEVTMSLLSANGQRRTSHRGSMDQDRSTRERATISSSPNSYGGRHDERENEESLDDIVAIGPEIEDIEERLDAVSRSMAGPSKSPQSTSARAGTLLGLHNVAIVVPQFVVTALSSLIFAIMEPKRMAAGQQENENPSESRNSDALGIIFRLGGCCAFIAGLLTIRLVRRYGDALQG